MAEIPRLIVDASIGTKWHLQDEVHADRAMDLLSAFRSNRIELLAPTQMRAEASSAILKAFRRRRLTIAQAEASILEIENWGVRFMPDVLLPESLRLAHRMGCSFYDAMYLALAEDIGVPFIHADDKLHRSISGRFPLELWIEDYEL